MKREGRQHGVVTCYPILPASLSLQRFVKMVDSASTMGLFTKVPTKPTNHSKFTGKCRKPRCNGCHIHPVCKSKDKVKGSMKIRSMDAENELTKYCFGTSATRVLAYLADDGGYDNDDYDYEDRLEENFDDDYGYGCSYSYAYDDGGYDNDDYDYEDRLEENFDDDYGYGCSYSYAYDDDHHGDDDVTHDIDLRVGFGNWIAACVGDEHENNVDIGEIDDDDETMSFCDVGLCWGHGDGDEYGDDGWYLVGGQMQ